MEMKDVPVSDADQAREKLRLKVAEGNAAGTVIEVEDELVIGRQATGDGTLGSDIEISRQHARIARGPEDHFLIEDLGSTNGTYVNGRQIENATRLETGDRIEVGATALVVQVGAIPPTPAAGTEVTFQASTEPPAPTDPPVDPGDPDAAVAADAGPADPPEVEEAVEGEPAPVSEPAPARMSLLIELDLDGQKATLSVDEHSEQIQLVLEDGRWRLAG